MQAMVDETVLAFGGVDLVVNNAGLSLSKSLLDTTAADWDLQHNVMAKGSFLVSKAAARVLIDQQMGGDIVYISSKNSVFAGPNNIAYSAVKADQAHQVRLLAAELGEHGVKVNGVNPDGVVQGSGIFAGGWGANRAAVYGVEEKDLGQVLRPAHDPQARGAPRAHRQRRLRALRSRHDPHDRAAHPRRRGRGGSVPPMTPDTRRVGRGRPRRHLGPGDGRRGRPGDAHADRGAPLPQRARSGVGGSLHWDVPGIHREVLAGLRAAAAGGPVHGIGIDSWAVDYGLLDPSGAAARRARTPTATRAPTAWPRRCWRRSTRPSCTPSPACSSCPSTRSTSWWPRPGPPSSSRRRRCSCSRTCWATG